MTLSEYTEYDINYDSVYAEYCGNYNETVCILNIMSQSEYRLLHHTNVFESIIYRYICFYPPPLRPQKNEVERNQEVADDDPRPQRGVRERPGVLHRRKDRRKVRGYT